MHSKNLLQAALQADWKNAGFGIYIHWPFCQAKCPYCDFNSHVSQFIDQQRWKNAYLKEIRHAAEQLPNRRVDSIFFGGGTPSLMEPEIVADIIFEIKKHWQISNDLEVTLESNPTSVEAGRFHGYAQGGVNRISMGIQAMNDTDLKALGRMHSAQDAINAFEIAKSQFDTVSFDLIYARQNQTAEDWQAELKSAIDLAVDHLSLYQLTIEPQTRFGDLYKRGKLRGLPNDSASADMYSLTQDICNDTGLNAYEISNHARDDKTCKHNLIYWRYGDYLGIGPGAHGRVTIGGVRSATETPLTPGVWLNDVETKETAITTTEILSDTMQATEYLLMSLRLLEGTELKRYEALASNPLDKKIMQELETDGFLQLQSNQLQATLKGRPVLNAILSKLLN